MLPAVFIQRDREYKTEAISVLWLHDNIENFSFQILISKSRYPDPGIYRSCKTYLDNINNDRDSANDPSFVTITEKAPARANPTNPFNSVLNVKALVGFCF